MSHVVTITSQGQLTIPRKLRTQLKIHGSTKAILHYKDGEIRVEPKKDFWSLAGSLKTKVKFTEANFKKGGKGFEKKWTRKI